MSVWLEVGRIGRAHGIRGDVLVTLTTDRVERLAPGSRLRSARGALEVEAARPHQSRWIVHFREVDDRSAAEALQGALLEAEALEDDGGELWVHNVIGAHVETVEGQGCGQVVAVHENPAHDLLELQDGTLVPVVFVIDERRADTLTLVIDPPSGLLPEPGSDDVG